MLVFLGTESLFIPPLTGVGHYTRNLLQGLRATQGVEVRCIPAGGVAAVSRLKRVAAAVPGLPQLRGLWRSARLRGSLRGAVYHEPNHILRLRHRPSVVTVHDLSVLHFPQFHPPERVRYFERHFARALKHAELIIVPSEFTRRDVAQTMQMHPVRLRCVPMGVDAEFRPLPAPAVAAKLAAYGLEPGSYLLAVGTREPRKNVARLLDAYLDLPKDLRVRHRLVLVGPPGWEADTLEQRLDKLARAGVLRLLGYVPDADRPALYNGAAGFAYPSLYEGFGTPPLEAVACGTPVLTSINSPMAETVGSIAELVDPLDTGSMTAGLVRLLSSSDLRARTLRDGVQRASVYSWGACVAGTLAVYREASDAV